MTSPARRTGAYDKRCGHGRRRRKPLLQLDGYPISREIARRGARVVGVDVSEKLIDKARAIDATEPLGISYIKTEAASRSILQDRVFDAVVSSFGLSDIDDLDGALATVARVPAPRGRFAFYLYLHVLPGSGRLRILAVQGSYYAEGWWAADGALSNLRRQVGANHRTRQTHAGGGAWAGKRVRAAGQQR